MPDAAWAVSVHPPKLIPEDWTRHQRFACARLPQSYLPKSRSDFPQRSPPSLLTTAACGGLRSTPDCRPRRALLHLSYSYASPCGPAMLVTQDPQRSLARRAWARPLVTFPGVTMRQTVGYAPHPLLNRSKWGGGM